MYLKTLKIKGFKSFARPTILNFSKGLSAIVGPNGAGKSNIVDAILWVLGEQNPRFLRGQTMQDVIFSGSEKLPPSPFAEVSLVFDNSTSILPFETNEVSIKRVVSRDGTSSYFINEKPCRLLDVRELISHLNLGVELPGIVPQNRIYDLINQNSSDLKAIIEESSGISYYRLRRENAIRKMEMANEKLEKLNIIKKELKRQLLPLKKQAEEYKKVLELRKTIEELEIKKAVAELKFQKSNYESISNEIGAIEAEIQRLQEELDSLSLKRSMLEKSFKKEENLYHQVQLVKKLKDQAANLNFVKLLIEEKARNIFEKITRQRNTSTSYGAEIAMVEQKIKDLKSELEETTKNLRSSKERYEKLQNAQEKLSVDFNKAKKSLNNLITELSELRARAEKHERSLEVLEKEQANLYLEQKRLFERAEFIEKTTIEIRKSLEIKNRRLDEIENEIASLTRYLKEKEEVVAHKQNQFEELSDVLKKTQARETSLKEELSLVESLLVNFKGDHLTAEKVSNLSEEELSVLKQALPYNHPLYIVFEDEFKKDAELPVQFVLTSRDGAKDKVRQVLLEIKKYLEMVKKLPRLNKEYFYHPAGYYYLSSSNNSYYDLILKRDHLSSELIKIQDEIKSLTERLKKTDEELDKERIELEKIKMEKRNLEEEKSKLTGDVQVLNSKIEFYLEERNDIQKRLNNLLQLIKEREKEKEKLSENLNNLKREISQKETLRVQAEKEFKSVKERSENLEKELREVKEQEKAFEFSKQSVEKELSALEKRLSELKTLSQASTEAIIFYEKKLNLLNKLHALVSDYLETANLIATANAFVEDYEKVVRLQSQEVKSILEKIEKIYERKSKLDSRLEILKNQLLETEKKIENLVKSAEELSGLPIARVFETYAPEKEHHIYAKELETLKEKLKEMGEYNPFALRDYETLSERYNLIKKQTADIVRAMENLRAIIEEVDKRIYETFKKSLEKLNANFENIYSFFSGGGNARIRIEPENNLEEARFLIEVSQPGKKLKNLTLLSGGEKSLTSLALLLALEETFKVPFMVLDEVEPALDEVNLEKVVVYLKKVSQKTQVIMVTHQPLTVEAADIIYGVTLDKDGSSRVYSLRLDEQVNLNA